MRPAATRNVATAGAKATLIPKRKTPKPKNCRIRSRRAGEYLIGPSTFHITGEKLQNIAPKHFLFDGLITDENQMCIQTPSSQSPSPDDNFAPMNPIPKSYRSRLIAIVTASFAISGMATEYLNNGSFESTFYSPGVPSFWKANAGDGNSNFRDTTHLSPFNNVYASGSQSVVMMDGSSDSSLPNLVQFFSPAPSRFALSFEFSLDSVSDAPWQIQIGSSSSSSLNLAFFINASNSLQFAGATMKLHLLTLAPTTWYQVNAIVDDPAGTISGSVTPYGTAPVAFSGVLVAGGPTATSYLEVLDASNSQNPGLCLDNLSIRTIPEPSFSAMLLSGSLLLICKRRLLSSPKPLPKNCRIRREEYLIGPSTFHKTRRKTKQIA